MTILILLSAIIITITMFCRANDQRYRPGFRWHLRLVGFVLAGTGAIPAALTLIFTPEYMLPFLTVEMVGITFVFLTTPNQKPWLRWIWKGDE